MKPVNDKYKTEMLERIEILFEIRYGKEWPITLATPINVPIFPNDITSYQDFVERISPRIMSELHGYVLSEMYSYFRNIIPKEDSTSEESDDKG